MTIDDKIKDEKLQYDINREAAKISALSSGKIDKYEYPTGEEILPPHQRRVIEQAKFTYSPLGKAFEKQTKTIEKQGKKQIDAITNQNERLKILTNKDDHKSIYREIFDKIVKEKFDEIKKLTDEIDNNDLIYYLEKNTARKNFNDFDNGIKLFRKIQSAEMKLEDAKELQNIFKTNLSKISKGRFKSKEHLSALENIKLLYESRQAVVKLFNDYSSIASEAKHKAKQRKGLKILTPKQRFQRLQIALAQVKAGITSENLLNKIRQVIYSL